MEMEKKKKKEKDMERKKNREGVLMTKKKGMHEVSAKRIEAHGKKKK
jgi:hypothetical protein